MNPGRFLLQAAGAGAGVWACENYILPNLPALPGPADPAAFGLDDVISGAAAVLGAMAGNALYSKFLGK